MMRDPILTAAQDPSCLMCLMPWGGGSWMSPLRQGAVWPSPEVSLLTLTNVIANGQYFEPVAKTQQMKITTPVDLRGKSAVTLIAKVALNISLTSPSTAIIFGQGIGYRTALFRIAPTTAKSFSFCGLFGNTNIPLDINGTIPLPASVNSTMVIAASFSSGNITLFIDGTIVASKTAPANALGTSNTTENQSVSFETLNPFQALNAKVYWAMVFDRALEQPEIAAFN